MRAAVLLGVNISESGLIVTQAAVSQCLRLHWAAVGLRSFSGTHTCAGKNSTTRREAEKVVEIPGLQPITYVDKMHFVPWLAKPTFPEWKRAWHDPHHYKGPRYEEMELYKEKPCYIFNQKTKILEGVRQALWLTKSKLIKGLPEHIVALAEDPANQIENQDERVQQAIQHARFWDTRDIRPKRERFCPVLMRDLIQLCGTLHARHPSLSQRGLAENGRVAVSWSRDAENFQVRGLCGTLLSSTSRLPVVAKKVEVLDTHKHTLESFYPISPAIDLQCTHVYKIEADSGFRDGYPFPHAHTLYIADSGVLHGKFKSEQLRAKMIMFTFANALVRAKLTYGDQPQVLEEPIVMQAVATNGRIFQFIVLQLNTTDLASDDGVKNIIWMDQDQLLYEYAKCLPLIKKKVVTVPAGLSGYKPDTFKKFLALFLHGGVGVPLEPQG
ncbi:39S ribosomal protein L37, mitochondrial [Polypterus senegalus]|uniref:39S ribosomal protein L37, mitochondrial n=1 Tax=Polypterus senegalus TaxID=55291 RepID=UPI0019643FC0|nr:39S ribosomal protein L37, mitochondrial [Polypterus senegalus]